MEIASALLGPQGTTSANSTASNHTRTTLYNLRNNERYKMTQTHVYEINQDSFNTNNSYNNNNFYENVKDSFNTDNSIHKVWNNCTIADEDSGILAWLSPLDPHIRHHDIRTRRVDKVGDWLLKSNEYQNWLGSIREDGSDGRALFCYGGPGVGKSYIR